MQLSILYFKRLWVKISIKDVFLSLKIALCSISPRSSLFTIVRGIQNEKVKQNKTQHGLIQILHRGSNRSAHVHVLLNNKTCCGTDKMLGKALHFISCTTQLMNSVILEDKMLGSIYQIMIKLFAIIFCSVKTFMFLPSICNVALNAIS